MGKESSGVGNVYINIPEAIWVSPELTLGEKILFGRILWFTCGMKSGICFETNRTISRYLNCDPQTVQKYLRTLIGKELVEREMIENRRNLSVPWPLIESNSWLDIFKNSPFKDEEY